MKWFRYLPLTALFFLCAACGGDDAGPAGPSTPLAVPAPAVAIDGLKATLRWARIDNARAYEYELYAEGAAAAETGSVPSITYSFEMSAGVAYRFRVRAVPAVGSAYVASGWSEEVSFSNAMLAAPVVKVDEEALTPTAARLYWTEVSGAAGYAYELYEGSATSASRSDRIEAAEVFFDDLTEATSYRFRVRALAAADDEHTQASNWSVAVSFTTSGGAGVDLGLPLAHENDGVVRAFPGAEGGGMYVSGGRGGAVYYVTTLEDNSSAGSLRYAVTRPGARTVVFDVAGDIILKSDLKITQGNLTIAGQTAPGGGICIRGGTVQVNADNIIMRYLRFRLGDESSFLSDGSDAIWGRYHENIILDHCSMSWSIDEVASFYANRNFTMQWCLVAEALRHSVHDKGSHGYGGIWGGRNASFHHNMLANNDSRNARIDHPGIYLQGTTDYRPTHRGNVDYRNNVIYNWGSNSTYGGEDGHYNMVGNYFKPGPASVQRNYFLDAYWYNSSMGIGTAYPELYLEDNYHAGSYATAINSDQWSGIYYHDQSSAGGGANPPTTAGRRTAPLPIKSNDTQTCYTTTHSAADAFDAVLAHVGASLRRDAVDSRITSDARTGTATYPDGGNGSTGGIIDTQSAVGGWPTLAATTDELARVKDSDGDGIPDYYEELFGLDKNDKADGNLKTLDPQGLYTNLEVYLHYLVRDITEAQVAGADYRALD